MGGDQFVAAVAGDDVEERLGDELRDAWVAQFDQMIDEVEVLDGARALLVAVKERGLDLILATSGKPKHVDHFLDLLDARSLADGWTTSDDVEKTKPAPDLVKVALDLASGGTAVMFGDSPWDCKAAAKLDIPTVALRTGGFPVAELREAGAVAVYDSLPALERDLDNTPLVGGNALRAH
jgi:phosphoglycolate phosphatase-like HAD superfamily hydrolase